MSPLEALGLGGDADERAVKRAYARRLKATRPDEDPQGFQALNEAYKAALALIARHAISPSFEPRASSGTAGWVTAQAADTVEGRRDEPDPMGAELEAHSREHVPIDGAETILAYAEESGSDHLRFDFDRFSADLFGLATDPSADVAGWLAATMAFWPLALKSVLAPRVLETLVEQPLLLPPRHLETILAAFDLDDVLLGFDALAVKQARIAAERTWNRHEAAERGRRLLLRENRRELSRGVRPAGYPPLVPRLLAFLLTSRHANTLSALRWMPPLARAAIGMLRYISGNSVEALAPPIEGAVLDRWIAAERRIGFVQIKHVVGCIAILVVVASSIWSMSTSSPDARTPPDDVATSDLGLSDIDLSKRFIADHPPPWPSEDQPMMADAYYNLGVYLQRAGRGEEADAAYKKLDDAFARSDETRVRLRVAEGDGNRAVLAYRDGSYDQAILVAGALASRSSASDPILEPEVDLQVAKALTLVAVSHERLGETDVAAISAAEVISRFGGMSDPTARSQVEIARALLRRLGRDDSGGTRR